MDVLKSRQQVKGKVVTWYKLIAITLSLILNPSTELNLH